VVAGLRKKGKTVFLTTHYMEEAEFLADHIAVIHKGKIIAEGSLEDLIRRYGKSSILHIKKCKDAPEVVKMLNQEGFTDVTSEGNGDIAVKIDYKERVLEILSHLRHDCIEYESIDIRRSNLEEVFLRLTGSKLMEEEQ
jgi:ABC-2 type transport system ATP-binding protein